VATHDVMHVTWFISISQPSNEATYDVAKSPCAWVCWETRPRPWPRPTSVYCLVFTTRYKVP